eukprot:SAG22_NODE_18578_length_285_cov_0.553763_1_plen_51_part_10
MRFKADFDRVAAEGWGDTPVELTLTEVRKLQARRNLFRDATLGPPPPPPPP